MSERSGPYIDATCEASCPETEIVVFKAEVRIFFERVAADGDSWNEPHVPAHINFDCAHRIDCTPHELITPGPLLKWAEEWLSIFEPEVEPARDYGV